MKTRASIDARADSIDSSSTSTQPHRSNVVEQVLEAKKRNRDMHHHFRDMIPIHDLCLADFTCTILRDNFLICGKLYLTSQHLCFHSYVKDTRIVIHAAKVHEIKQLKCMQIVAGLKLYFNKEELVFQHFFFPRNAERCIREIVAAYERFKLGSRDSACDLVSVPRSVQRKISQILELQLTSGEENEEEANLKKLAVTANEESFVISIREVMFLLLVLFALMINVYCFMASFSLLI